jgi:CDP-diacylglycerol--glycerol-3-phosphate 3-phosphatidyltransferase/cardiolipin synthase
MLGLAALSDVLDGWLARSIRARLAHRVAPAELARAARLGSWLDPACDKAFVASILLAAVVGLRVPWLGVLLVVVRDVIIAALLAARRLSPALRAAHIDYTARASGKLTTVVQFAALTSALLVPAVFVPLAAAAALLGVVAAGDYVLRVLRGRAASEPASPLGGRAHAV